MTGAPAPAPAAAASATLARLREACADAGYHERAIAARIDSRPGSPPPPRAARERLAGTDRLGLLIRLLRLGSAVPARDAAAALAPARLDELAQAGLLLAQGPMARARFRIQPHDGLLVAADHVRSERLPADLVAGVSVSAVTLAHLTARPSARSALDLGTGTGIHALLAARHAERVVGTDVNPRALAFAELNRRLNATAPISWRRGSWLEPVAGERFDLVVSNPPFVISPDFELLLRDSGRPGDALVRELLGRIPAHLEEGGFAHVQVSWVVPNKADWSTRLREWVDGSGCDAVLLCHAVEDPVAYAAEWNRPLAEVDPAGYERALDRWLAHYEELGIEAIGLGAVVLRRRTGAGHWVAALELWGAPTAPAGDHVLRLFAAHDRLAALRDDADLLDVAPALVDGHRIDQTLVRRDGRYRSHRAVVRPVEGMNVRALVDPDALDVLFSCDGRRPLREGIATVAEARAQDRAALAATVAEAARELAAAGLLVL